tara:strand:+ start:1865 stop:2095 length:231 start_codon:yes stop_codon:yes gene_type:complete
MTIQQEAHQLSRYGRHNYNNHEGAVGGGNPLHKHQDYINNAPNVITGNKKDISSNIRKIQQRKKEGSVLVSDNPYQ